MIMMGQMRYLILSCLALTACQPTLFQFKGAPLPPVTPSASKPVSAVPNTQQDNDARLQQWLDSVTGRKSSVK